jgi:hypothetical protein
MGFFSGFAGGWTEGIKGSGKFLAEQRNIAKRRAEDRAVKIEDEARRMELGLAQKGVNINDLKTGKPLSSGNLTPTELMAEYTQRTATHYEPANVATRKMYTDRQEAETTAENLGYTSRNTGEEVIDPWTGKKVERVNTAAKEMQEDLRTKREDETADRNQKRTSAEVNQVRLHSDYSISTSDKYGIFDAVIIKKDEQNNTIYEEGPNYDKFKKAVKETANIRKQTAELALEAAIKEQANKDDKITNSLSSWYTGILPSLQDFMDSNQAYTNNERFKNEIDTRGIFYDIAKRADKLSNDIKSGAVKGKDMADRIKKIEQDFGNFLYKQKEGGALPSENPQWNTETTNYIQAIYPTLLIDTKESSALRDERGNVIYQNNEDILLNDEIDEEWISDYRKLKTSTLDSLTQKHAEATSAGNKELANKVLARMKRENDQLATLEEKARRMGYTTAGADSGSYGEE